MKIITVLFITIILISCTGPVFMDKAIRDGMQAGGIHIGASKSVVAASMGITSIPSFCVKQKMKEDGEYVMWDFATNLCGSNLTQSYVLIFKNDKLIEIRTVQSQLDMQF